MGRPRLPPRADRRGHPADRPHPRRRRRVLGDDDHPPVPQGAGRARGADPPRRCRRNPARRDARRDVHRGHRARAGRAAPRARGRSPGALDAGTPGGVSAVNMPPRRVRGTTALATALVLVLATAGTALAARDWTIDASPSSLDEGATTTVTID